MTAQPHATTYVFEPSRREHERLVAMARFYADDVRDACRRAGIGPGHRVIDVGCGPLGALPVLAEVVGPHGAVVGLDVSPEALATARASLDAQGLRHVDLIQSDLMGLGATPFAAGARFDAAHCRYVLMHQADPAAALRRIASVVRPGGAILVRDLLDDPAYCRSDPPLPALQRGFALLFEAIGRKGGARDVARRYRAVCHEAGLEVVEQRGLLSHFDAPAQQLGALRSGLLGMQRVLEESGLSSAAEVERLCQELEAAQTAELGLFHGPLMVDLLARVPAPDARHDRTPSDRDSLPGNADSS